MTATSAMVGASSASTPLLSSLVRRPEIAVETHPSSLPTSFVVPAEPCAASRESFSEVCLFCDQTFSSAGANHAHMQSRHGLHIPYENLLIVHIDSIIRYLRLMINEDLECIFCFTRRNSPRAVQQHMLSKGHCRISVGGKNSEFRDFYDFGGSSSEPDGDNLDHRGDGYSLQTQGLSGVSSSAHILHGEGMLQLPSGKIISRNNDGSSKHSKSQKHRKSPSAKGLAQSTNISNGRSSSVAQRSPTPYGPESVPHAEHPLSIRNSLTPKQVRREKELTLQLAKLRDSDRQALSHLSLPEQRVFLAQTQKQTDKADRTFKAFGGKMDKLGNQKGMERFVNDVPGGRSHRCRYLVK